MANKRAFTVRGTNSVVELIRQLVVEPGTNLTAITENSFVLHSSQFDDYSTTDEALAAVRVWLAQAAALIQVFVGDTGNLDVTQMAETLPNGEQQTSSFSNPFNIAIRDPHAKSLLGRRLESGRTVFCELLRSAEDHSDVRRVLSIIGFQPIGWVGVYDTLEAMGGPNGIMKRRRPRWETDQDGVNTVWNTSGVNRHPGNLQTDRLPPNPPKLHDARQYAFGLVYRLLAEKSPDAFDPINITPPEISIGHQITVRRAIPDEHRSEGAA